MVFGARRVRLFLSVRSIKRFKTCLGFHCILRLFLLQGYNVQGTLLILGWKRLLLAEGPRQVLNAITLYSVAKGQNFSFNIHQYQQVFTTVQGVVMSFMLLTRYNLGPLIYSSLRRRFTLLATTRLSHSRKSKGILLS